MARAASVRSFDGVFRQMAGEGVDGDLRRYADAGREERAVEDEETADAVVLAGALDDALFRIFAEAERAHGMDGQ